MREYIGKSQENMQLIFCQPLIFNIITTIFKKWPNYKKIYI